MIFEKSLDEITEEDLNYLISDQTQEGINLEYKEDFQLENNEHKRKLLKTVSAFANTSGGLLIYGIKEDRDKGVPEKLVGLKINNSDQEIMRITNIIRNRSEPAISIEEPKIIELSDTTRKILVIKVFQSWNKPHRVKLNGKTEFFIRIGNQSTPMNIGDLKNAFNLSESLLEHIRRFREERISKILSNDTPINLFEGAKTAIHIIPLNSFNIAQTYEITKIKSNNPNDCRLLPMRSNFADERYNIDGILSFNIRNGTSNGYVQLFRNGIIESVDVNMLNINKDIPKFYERTLLESINEYLMVLNDLNVETPFLVFITLIGVKGYEMDTNAGYKVMAAVDPDVAQKYVIDRNILLLPETFLETYPNFEDLTLLFKPSFDALWNSCGFESSKNYDKNGVFNK